jgi:flagellar motility protein MotE (MotC chaperone)
METRRVPHRRPGIVACLALAALLPGAASNATEVVAPAEPQSQSEIERFCTGIADAARDRRYSLQAAELKKLQADLDERIQRLEAKRAEYEQWMKRREEFLKKAEDNVVKIYAAMKPDEAATKLAELNGGLAAGILMKLESRKAGVILNEMNAKSAAKLTGIMAATASREDPS